MQQAHGALADCSISEVSGLPFSVHVAVNLLLHTELLECACCCPLILPPVEIFPSSMPILQLHIQYCGITHA